MSRSARLRVVEPNPLVTVQDRGRQGAMRYGVSQSGPMDWVRHEMALALVGAQAALEIGIQGAVLEAEGTVRLALTGPGFEAHLATERHLSPVVLTLSDARLTIAPGSEGMWAYVAVEGIDFGPPVLGSHATNARTGLGARDLSAGFSCAAVDSIEPEIFEDPLPDDEAPIAILAGPQNHLFDEGAQRVMVEEAFALTGALDRMGYRLEGPQLKASTHDIVSDGIVEGAIQVPGNGQPIVLCADRQPTGGYPKIAVVASASRPVLTQRRPGAEVRFAWTDVAGARQQRRKLMERARAPVARVRRSFDFTQLAGKNLISGVWPVPQADEREAR